MPPLRDSRRGTSRTQNPLRLTRMAGDRPLTRDALVEDIRLQVREGRYVNREKLNLAIHRMLSRMLG